MTRATSSADAPSAASPPEFERRARPASRSRRCGAAGALTGGRRPRKSTTEPVATPSARRGRPGSPGSGDMLGAWDGRHQRLVGRVPGCGRPRGGRLAGRRQDVVEGLARCHQLVVLLGQPLDLGVRVELLALLGEEGVLVLQLAQLGGLGRQLVVLAVEDGQREAGGQDDHGATAAATRPASGCGASRWRPVRPACGPGPGRGAAPGRVGRRLAAVGGRPGASSAYGSRWPTACVRSSACVTSWTRYGSWRGRGRAATRPRSVRGRRRARAMLALGRRTCRPPDAWRWPRRPAGPLAARRSRTPTGRGEVDRLPVGAAVVEAFDLGVEPSAHAGAASGTTGPHHPEGGRLAELLLDAQQLVVLGDPVGPGRGAGLDLAAVGGHGQVGDGGVLGLPRAVRHHAGVRVAGWRGPWCRASR